MFGCLLIYHHSSLAFICECPISMVMLLDNVKAYYTSCELLSTFQILDNQCLWWENMERLYWKAFHPGSFLLSCRCYDECPFFSSWNTVPEAAPYTIWKYNGDFLLHTPERIDLSMVFQVIGSSYVSLEFSGYQAASSDHSLSYSAQGKTC